MQWPTVGNAAEHICFKNYFCIEHFKPYFIVYQNGSLYFKISLELMKFNPFITHTGQPMKVRPDVEPTLDQRLIK